jgi:hypothetical protein
MSPAPSNTEIRNTAPRSSLGNDFTLLSSPGVFIKEGEELCLTYGFHSSRTLFVEYGFVNECLDDNYDGEVEIQDILERLFESKGTIGITMKEILVVEGYWGFVMTSLTHLGCELKPFRKGLDSALFSEPCPSVISSNHSTTSLCERLG